MKSNNQPPLILVADRDSVERAQLKAVLKLKGFRVIEAAQGPQAIALAMDYRPDLLLLDLKLPKLRSSEVIWMIRREPGLRRMPIIAVSDSGTGPMPLDSRTVHARRPIEYTQLDRLLTRFLQEPLLLSAAS